MIWAPFLHWYQPPNQLSSVIRAVIRESYDPILSLVERYPNARITLNINGCLTEKLAEINPELLERIKRLVVQGQIELTASAKYHPLLPLIPPYERERQINLNNETNRYFFGDNYAPHGFFSPELAFSEDVAATVSKMGFEWMLLDEISFNGLLSNEGFDAVYVDKDIPSLKLFFADRQTSHALRILPTLEPQLFLYNIKASARKEQYLITANDGEIFGHHYKKREEVLAYAFADPAIQTMTLSQIIKNDSRKLQPISPRNGSWETSENDMKNNNFFPLWKNPANKIHMLQWELAQTAIELMERTEPPQDDVGLVYASSRAHLDRGLHSCHFWWASACPWWNPDMIIDGATELIRSIRGLPHVPQEVKKRAEKIYVKIVDTTWEWHWGGQAEKLISQYDQERNKFLINKENG